MTPPLRILLGCVALLPALTSCDRTTPASSETSRVPTSAPALAATNLPASAVPNSFQEVIAQLDPGGSLYLYLSTEQWLAGLAQQIANARQAVLTAAEPTARVTPELLSKTFDAAVDVVGQSGLEDVTGFGVSNFALAPGVNRSKIFLHHQAGKGKGFLWSIWGGPAHALDSLAILPAQTALASVHDVDFSVLQGLLAREAERLGTPEIKAQYAQGMQQVASILGMPVEEAMKSMSGPTGLVMTLDPAHLLQPQGPTGPSVPTPQLALVLHNANDRIFNQLDQTFGTNPTLIRVDEAGLKMRTLPDVPTPFGMTLRPTAALWGNYLILATTDQLVRDMMAAGKNGGFAKTPEFASMAADLPTTGNGFQIVTKAFSDLLAELQGEMLQNQPATSPQQAALVKQLFAQSAGASSFAVFANLDNGWLATSKTSSKTPPVSFGTLLTSLVAANATAVASAASPVPSPASVAVGGAPAADSLNQARQIYFACVRYAGDNAGNFPPDLAALVPRYLPEAKTLVSPYAPRLPVGYRYTAGLSQDSPADSILLEDSQSTGAKVRVLVRVNGMAETLPVP